MEKSTKIKVILLVAIILIFTGYYITKSVIDYYNNSNNDTGDDDKSDTPGYSISDYKDILVICNDNNNKISLLEFTGHAIPIDGINSQLNNAIINWCNGVPMNDVWSSASVPTTGKNYTLKVVLIF